MLKKIAFLFFATLVATGNILAQQCGTDDVFRQLKAEHPEIASFDAQLEQSMILGMQRLQLKKLMKTTDDTTTYDVPIVIHIVHDYGVEYLSDNAIYDAVKYWIDVYQARNADTADVITPFKPYVGNARIRLHLATKDPNGNPTKGITRHQSYLTGNAGDQAKLDDWPNNSYINLWFIKQFSADHAGAAAYAYYPSSGAFMPYYDGVIGLYSYINYDKAIPHEIGHVLNLQHVWGNNNSAGVACGDDDVDDTPPTKGHLPGCNATALYDGTCAANYYKTYVINGVTTIIDYPDTTNAQNIMDYTYCQKMFTKGQADRMRLALTSSVAGRNNLYTAANLAATGALSPMPDLPPVAEFSVEKAAISALPLTTEKCYFLGLGTNLNFVFYNRSWNDTVTNVAWTFSNGAATPTSNSTTSINNNFTQPGWVTVSLTATGNNTGATTVTNTHAVYVADSVMHGAMYQQEFSSTAAMDQWPMFNYYNNNFKWEWFNGAGVGDNACVRYTSFDTRSAPENKSGTPVGDYDDIFTPGFNLSSFAGSNINLNSYTAGSYASGSASTDTFQVYASNDLGRTWSLVTTIGGTDLANNGKITTAFTPSSAAQWKARTISIPVANRVDKVFFKFRYRPGTGGNNFYFDRFSVSPFTTEVKEIANQPAAVKVYPNPSQGATTVAFTTGVDGDVQYMVKDITGKTLYQQTEQLSPNTFTQKQLPANIFPAAGVYLVTVTISGQSVTQKLIVQ